MKCETCTRWTRTHTATPWYPPSSGSCELTLPPYITNLLQQLAPPYVETTTDQNDTCSFHAPGRVEEPTPPLPGDD